MRHEDKTKSNAYWRNLLCHLHPDSASRKVNIYTSNNQKSANLTSYNYFHCCIIYIYMYVYISILTLWPCIFIVQDIPCIKDVASLYKLVRVEDIHALEQQDSVMLVNTRNAYAIILWFYTILILFEHFARFFFF